MARVKRPRGRCAAWVPFLLRSSSHAHIIGVVVSETTSEISTDTDSVTPNSRNSRPAWPPMNSSGMNTAISDRLIDSTVKPTSLAPTSAAWKRSMPCSMWRLVFSSTTMASSTTKPVATVSAIRLRLSRLKLSRYITPKVPSSDTTVAMAGTIVARRLCRNSPTTSTTSATEMMSVTSTSRSEERMELVLSEATCSSMSAGSCALSSGTSARTPSTVVITLAPGCFVMITTTAGLPLNSPSVRTSSGPSVTLAMSSSFTAAPLR